MSHVIQLDSGNFFDFNHPEGGPYIITDIAHALSNLCRFNGHSKQFYSVAQHSVIASHHVTGSLALAALLHDASEAYLGDVATPLKALLPDYRVLEEEVERAIFSEYKIPWPAMGAIKQVDLRLLATEKRDLIAVTPADRMWWGAVPQLEPYPEVIAPWPPEVAERAFLERFYEVNEWPR